MMVIHLHISHHCAHVMIQLSLKKGAAAAYTQLSSLSLFKYQAE